MAIDHAAAASREMKDMVDVLRDVKSTFSEYGTYLNEATRMQIEANGILARQAEERERIERENNQKIADAQSEWEELQKKSRREQKKQVSESIKTGKKDLEERKKAYTAAVAMGNLDAQRLNQMKKEIADEERMLAARESYLEDLNTLTKTSKKLGTQLAKMQNSKLGKLFSSFFGKLTAVLGGATLGAAVLKIINDSDTTFKNIAKSAGVSVGAGSKLSSEFERSAGAAAAMGMTVEELGSTATSMIEGFGSAAVVTRENMLQVGAMTKTLGVDAGTAVGYFKTMSVTMGLGATNAREFSNTVRNEAIKGGVAASLVFRDLSDFAADTSKSFGMSPEYLKRASIRARQLGTSIGEVASAGESFHDMENSLKITQKAQLLFGAKMNAMELTRLARAGKYEQVQDKVYDSLKNQIDANGEIQITDIAQQKLLEETLGKDWKNILKARKFEDKIAKMGLATEEEKAAALQMMMADSKAFAGRSKQQNIDLIKQQVAQQDANKGMVEAAKQFQGVFAQVGSLFKAVVTPILTKVSLIMAAIFGTSEQTFSSGERIGETIAGWLPSVEWFAAKMETVRNITGKLNETLDKVGRGKAFGALTAIVGGVGVAALLKKKTKADGSATSPFWTRSADKITAVKDAVKNNATGALTKVGAGITTAVAAIKKMGADFNKGFTRNKAQGKGSVRGLARGINAALKGNPLMRSILKLLKGLPGGFLKKIPYLGAAMGIARIGLNLQKRATANSEEEKKIAEKGLAAATGQVAGTAIGAALGSFLLPGIGTVIGGMLGGIIGEAIGGALYDNAAKFFEPIIAQFKSTWVEVTGTFDAVMKIFRDVVSIFESIGTILSNWTDGWVGPKGMGLVAEGFGKALALFMKPIEALWWVIKKVAEGLGWVTGKAAEYLEGVAKRSAKEDPVPEPPPEGTSPEGLAKGKANKVNNALADPRKPNPMGEIFNKPTLLVAEEKPGEMYLPMERWMTGKPVAKEVEDGMEKMGYKRAFVGTASGNITAGPGAVQESSDLSGLKIAGEAMEKMAGDLGVAEQRLAGAIGDTTAAQVEMQNVQDKINKENLKKESMFNGELLKSIGQHLIAAETFIGENDELMAALGPVGGFMQNNAQMMGDVGRFLESGNKKQAAIDFALNAATNAASQMLAKKGGATGEIGGNMLKNIQDGMSPATAGMSALGDFLQKDKLARENALRKKDMADSQYNSLLQAQMEQGLTQEEATAKLNEELSKTAEGQKLLADKNAEIPPEQKDAMSMLKNGAGALMTGAVGMIAAGKGMKSALKEQAKLMIEQAAIQQAQKLAETAGNAAAAIPVIGPLVKPILMMLVQFVPMLVKWLMKNWKKIPGMIVGVFKKIPKLFGRAVKALGKIHLALIKLWVKYIKFLVNLPGHLVKLFKKIFGPITKPSTWLKLLLAVFLGPIVVLTLAVKKFFPNLFKKIAKLFGKIFGPLTSPKTWIKVLLVVLLGPFMLIVLIVKKFFPNLFKNLFKAWVFMTFKLPWMLVKGLIKAWVFIFIKLPIMIIKGIFKLFKKIFGPISKPSTWLKLLAAILMGPFILIGLAIKAFFPSLFSKIWNVFKALPKLWFKIFIKLPIKLVIGFIKIWLKVARAVIGFFRSIPGRIVRIFKKIGGWFAGIPGKMVKAVKGVVKKLKFWSEGTVVNKPTMGMIGETNEKEMVVPIDRIKSGGKVNPAVMGELNSLIPFITGAQGGDSGGATAGAGGGGDALLNEIRMLRQEIAALANRPVMVTLDGKQVAKSVGERFTDISNNI